jgi:hypothetical protein
MVEATAGTQAAGGGRTLFTLALFAAAALLYARDTSAGTSAADTAAAAATPTPAPNRVMSAHGEKEGAGKPAAVFADVPGGGATGGPVLRFEYCSS